MKLASIFFKADVTYIRYLPQKTKQIEQNASAVCPIFVHDLSGVCKKYLK